jgi:replicative DNA helicase
MSDSIRKLSDVLKIGDELKQSDTSDNWKFKTKTVVGEKPSERKAVRTDFDPKSDPVSEEPETVEETSDLATDEAVSQTTVNNQLVLEHIVLGIFFKNPSKDMACTLRDYGPVVPLYSSESRPLVKIIFRLIDNAEEMDFAIIVNAAEKAKALTGIGGQAGIEKLISSTFASEDEFAIHVQRLKDYHTVRRIRSVLESGLTLVNQGKRDPQQILNMLRFDFEKISDNANMDNPRALGSVLEDLHQRTLMGTVTGFRNFESGFEALDRTIKGLGQGELILIGGAQGVGKTIMALQMARNIAYTGQARVLYICFEHGEDYLLKRLIPMESVNPFGLTPFDLGLVEKDVLEGIRKASDGKVGFTELLRTSERGKRVLDRLDKYKDDLILYKGNTFKTTLQSIRRMAIDMRHETEKNIVVFVDYLQKVPVYPEPANENEKVTTITEGLKDIALSLEIPVISIVAADKEGLKAKRMRLHHLRGSSALDYEADIALILNEKSKIISKTNVAYNPSKLAEYNRWIICTVEKNRTGRKMVDLEFEKHFKFFCFDPRGGIVQEQLIEERIFTE